VKKIILVFLFLALGLPAEAQEKYDLQLDYSSFFLKQERIYQLEKIPQPKFSLKKKIEEFFKQKGSIIPVHQGEKIDIYIYLKLNGLKTARIEIEIIF